MGVDINNAKKQWGDLRHDPLRQSQRGWRRFGVHLINLTKRSADQIGGADYTFDCTGNVTAMRKRSKPAIAAEANPS
jgi:S-(hydroxymethyl)glutathione dehydrogenase / alcohol dehydrogenase